MEAEDWSEKEVDTRVGCATYDRIVESSRDNQTCGCQQGHDVAFRLASWL